MLAAAVLVAAAPATAKYAAIVVDADTGAVLHGRNADTLNYPASLTKMMTLYMLFDAVEQGRYTLTSELSVSARAAGMSPTKLGLPPGSTIRVDDAIQALITKSANDVAAVVAENLAGSESKFAAQMTEKARAIGMRRSTFKNASGLPNDKQRSTARDMAILAKRLMMDFPQHYHYFGRTDYVHGGAAMRTHNNLLLSYQGADGIKTGYTVASGFNLVTSAHRDGKRLIGVVFGGKTARSRDAHMADLLDAGFAKLAKGGEFRVAAPRLEDFDMNGSLPTLEALAPVAVGDADDGAAVSARTPSAATVKSAAPALPAGKAFGIQVGAYGEKARAQDAADTARARLKAKYPEVVVRIQPTPWQGRTLYRAQVLGLAQADTKAACALAAIKTKVPCQAVGPIGATKTAAKSKTQRRAAQR
ncbi:MAG: D-alanyl-D-alanine carboxypeptidase [Rhodospirillaceae bacterium]|nr:D-alanyl-D-alanine carboxypeptidase [Rhodospirillaceae bacterium]